MKQQNDEAFRKRFKLDGLKYKKNVTLCVFLNIETN